MQTPQPERAQLQTPSKDKKMRREEDGAGGRAKRWRSLIGCAFFAFHHPGIPPALFKSLLALNRSRGPLISLSLYWRFRILAGPSSRLGSVGALDGANLPAPQCRLDRPERLCSPPWGFCGASGERWGVKSGLQAEQAKSLWRSLVGELNHISGDCELRHRKQNQVEH